MTLWLSVSESSSKEATHHTRFHTIGVRRLSEIADIMLLPCWSPIVWLNGRRGESHFHSCQLGVLDIDGNGMSIEEAAGRLKKAEVSFVIGPTKSHRKEKVSKAGKVTPAQDRYRIAIVWSKPITNLDVFDLNMKRLIEKFQADFCIDAARLYWGCTEIFASSSGKLLNPQPLPQGYLTRAERLRKQCERVQIYRDNNALPRWIISILDQPIPVGERNRTCYSLAKWLKRYGRSEDEILGYLTQASGLNIPTDEIKRAVHNGFRKA